MRHRWLYCALTGVSLLTFVFAVQFLVQVWEWMQFPKITATDPNEEAWCYLTVTCCAGSTHLQNWLHLVEFLSKIYGRLWGHPEGDLQSVDISRRCHGLVVILKGKGRSWNSCWGKADRRSCRIHVFKASSGICSCCNLHCSMSK